MQEEGKVKEREYRRGIGWFFFFFNNVNVTTLPLKKKNNKSSRFFVFKIIEGVQAYNDIADWLQNNTE